MHIPKASTDPLLRALKRGEVGVSFYPNNRREILPESDFRLIDRPMQPGDICKRSYEGVQSAVVTNVDIRFKVSHAISGSRLEEWKTMDDVKEFDDITIGDFVECNGWIGQVQDVRTFLCHICYETKIVSSTLMCPRSKLAMDHLYNSPKSVHI